MIETPFTRALGIDAPVVEAPIAPTPELVAAVSSAGGLGLLPITWLDEATVRAVIRTTHELTDRPFGVNLVLDQARGHLLDAALEEGVSAVTFFWGNPEPYLERVHDAGALATLTVGSAEEARRAAAVGADAVVAQGWEAGGHVRGQVATLPLVPAVKDAVGPLPVVAAGGVADGRGLAAVLALGADAAWLGTRFIASEEAPFTNGYKARIISAIETDTIYTSLFDIGWPDAPHRVLHNSTTQAWQAAGCPEHGARPGEAEIIAVSADGTPLPRYGVSEPTVTTTGNLEALAHYAGQSAALIHAVQPAGQIVRELVDEAESILQRLD